MHESGDVAQRVQRTHRGGFCAIVTEQLHLMRLVQFLPYGVWLVGELLLQLFIDWQTMCNVLNKARYLTMVFILPGIHTCPMLVEVVLNDLHLL